MVETPVAKFVGVAIQYRVCASKGILLVSIRLMFHFLLAWCIRLLSE